VIGRGKEDEQQRRGDELRHGCAHIGEQADDKIGRLAAPDPCERAEWDRDQRHGDERRRGERGGAPEILSDHLRDGQLLAQRRPEIAA
jgi:hypothetical protein